MSWLSNLIVKITGDNSSLNDSLDGAEKKVAGFKTKIVALAGIIAGAVVGAFMAWKKVMESTEGTAEKLEQMTALVKGGYQGLMTTIATGDWGGLIDNISKTAKAYRDLAAAQQLAEHIESSNEVKKAYLERVLQSSRIAYASAEDPVLKAQYLQEAIDAQKAITDITVNEAKARMEAFEQQYKTLSGLDDEAASLMITNFRKIAGNWETFFGKNGQLALLQINKQSLAYKDQLGILTDTEKVEYKRVQAAIANLELFQEFEDSMKPEQFAEYIKSISVYINEIARGDQAIYRLTNTLGGLQNKIGSAPTGFERAEAPNKAAIPTLGVELPGLQGTNIQVEKELTELEKILTSGRNMAVDLGTQLVEGLGSALAGADMGDLGKNLLMSLANFLSQFGKLLVTFGIAQTAFYKALVAGPHGGAIAIAAGVAALLAAGAIKGLLSRGSGGSSMGGSSYGQGNYQPQTQTIKVQVEGKISGKDLGIALRRQYGMG